MKDYYKILGVSSLSNSEQIKKARKQKAKKLHPDVNKSPNAHSEFIEMESAYQILIDPIVRKQYDELFSSYNRKSTESNTNNYSSHKEHKSNNNSQQSYNSNENNCKPSQEQKSDYDFNKSEEKAQGKAEENSKRSLRELVESFEDYFVVKVIFFIISFTIAYSFWSLFIPVFENLIFVAFMTGFIICLFVVGLISKSSHHIAIGIIFSILLIIILEYEGAHHRSVFVEKHNQVTNKSVRY